MTIASHRRRLDALAPTERPLTLADLLEDSDEQKAAKAVKAVCAFARALVAPVPAPPGARHSSGAFSPPEGARPSAEVTPRESRSPDAHSPTAEPVRLDPREVVTVAAAMAGQHLYADETMRYVAQRERARRAGVIHDYDPLEEA